MTPLAGRISLRRFASAWSSSVTCSVCSVTKLRGKLCEADEAPRQRLHGCNVPRALELLHCARQTVDCCLLLVVLGPGHFHFRWVPPPPVEDFAQPEGAEPPKALHLQVRLAPELRQRWSLASENPTLGFRIFQSWSICIRPYLTGGSLLYWSPTRSALEQPLAWGRS